MKLSIGILHVFFNERQIENAFGSVFYFYASSDYRIKVPKIMFITYVELLRQE